MLTRRDVLKQAGTLAALATTAPWWLVRRAHAARREKLIVWQPVALAPQVDKLLKEQRYAYAKQAGIKENELEYIEIGTGQLIPKIVAALEAGIPPDVCRGGQGQGALYRAQGHLLEVTDIVDKMQQVPGGLFEASLTSVMYKGKAYSVPRSVSPSPLVARMISWRWPRWTPRRPGMSSSRSAKNCRNLPSSLAMACAWGYTPIPKAM